MVIKRCDNCGKQILKTPGQIRHSKSGKYFCNKSCSAVWKNKKRIKIESKILDLWRLWCSSSTILCGRISEGANPSSLPFYSKKKKPKRISTKRPSKWVLFDLYWIKNNTQEKISNIYGVTHASVKRWLKYYKISTKSRKLSCGKNLNSLKNLELGKKPEAERKAAESRKIYTKEALIDKIKKFVKENGRVPSKNEFVKNYSSYPNHTTYSDNFGSWNRAIEVAGYKPNEAWFFSAKDHRAKDGHKCNSISEIIIDDWLFKNKIYHERECLYPEGKFRCDFVINGVFIEFFGLSEASSFSVNYTIHMEKKRELCKKYNISLIELYGKDLYNLEETLGPKLGIDSGQKSLL